MQLPPGIAYGNGRLEADAIDIDTKFAGRIAKLFVDEGDIVRAGQVVAMMDTRDLEASLKKSHALVSQAERRSKRRGRISRYSRRKSHSRTRSSTVPALSFPKALPQLKFSTSDGSR